MESIIYHNTIPTFEDYFQPKSVDEAVSLLAEYGEEARILAGGTDLVPQMRNRILTPKCLVDINRIPGLDYISLDEGNGIRIGALTTIHSLGLSEVIKKEYLLLHEAASQMATTEIRNVATVAGNICRASPLADTACPLLALDAEVKIVGHNKSKTVALGEFFLGPGETILNPDEMVTEIRVPKLATGTGTAFLRLTRVAADLAKVNVATVLTLKNGVCQEAKIALGAVAPTPIRARKAEEVLKGKKLEDGIIENAAEMASSETVPITDLRSTAEYRREVSKVLVRRAITISLERAR